MMNDQELEHEIKKILPGADMEVECDGMLVVYTNLYPLPDGSLVELPTRRQSLYKDMEAWRQRTLASSTD